MAAETIGVQSEDGPTDDEADPDLLSDDAVIDTFNSAMGQKWPAAVGDGYQSIYGQQFGEYQPCRRSSRRDRIGVYMVSVPAYSYLLVNDALGRNEYEGATVAFILIHFDL